jgi:uncharacterized membrane protein
MSSPVDSDVDHAESPTGEPPAWEGGARLVGRIPHGHLIALVSLVVAYTTAITYLSQLRIDNFYAGAWDLGINQQMLWTSAHGFLLYETPDRAFYGTQSFLGVHSTYLALAVVPLYSAAPYPATLFALQSAGVAIAIFPLYFLARRVISNPFLLFLVLALFLLNFGVISGLLYDFHWEAFVPLEFLWFFVLVRQRSYRLSLIPMIAGFLTLEVFPFLVGGIVLLVFYERVRALGLRMKELLRDRDVRIQIGFLSLAILAYLAIRLIQYWVIPPLVGSQSVSGQLSGAVTSPFAISVTAQSFPLSVLYWVLLLASLGFIPLFAPKSLLLTLPWFINSVLLMPAASSAFGNQYALVAMTTLSVAFIEGFALLPRKRADLRSSLVFGFGAIMVAAIAGALAFWDSRALLSGAVNAALWSALLIPPFVVLLSYFISIAVRRPVTTPRSRLTGPRAVRWRTLRTPLLAGTVTVLIAFNVGMSPINPTNFQATAMPGYSFQFGSSPVSSQMGWISSYVPQNGVILAANNLFPFVANNPNAWPTPWYPYGSQPPPPYFPFNESHLPKYVLIDSSQWSTFPTSIEAALLNDSTYGLVSYIFSQAWPGTVYLFEQGYTQVPVVRDATPTSPTYFFTSSNLSLGPAGVAIHTSSAKFGEAIESRLASPTSSNNTNVWYGPYLTFPSGSYRLTFNLSGSPNFAGPRPNQPVLLLDSSPRIAGAPSILSVVITASQLSDLEWETFSYNITLTLPYPLVEFRGYVYNIDGQPAGQVVLNYIELSPI